eukprot:1035718-Rhodomonas_salina.1
MRKQFFWGCRTDSTDCLTSTVVAMSGEMALPGANTIPASHPKLSAVFGYPVPRVSSHSPAEIVVQVVAVVVPVLVVVLCWRPSGGGTGVLSSESSTP